MGIGKALLAVLFLGVAATTNQSDDVWGFGCNTPQHVSAVNVRDVYAAYGSRSVAIINAAMANDGVTLAKMVSPSAKFTLFAGDVGIGPRSAGPAAAIEFVRQIAPRTYQFSAGSSGPFSMDPCSSTNVEMTLVGNQAGDAIVATFKYRDGILAEVQGSHVELIEGEFPNSIAH
jgi:hypothetical protein